jgi:phosphoribosylformylglycinamidine cyclo-ligase
LAIHERKVSTYEGSGVSVELGNDLSRTLYEAAKQTWVNRQGRFGEMREMHESFFGFRAMPLDLLPNTGGLYTNMGSDGAATKIEVAERTLDHSTIAHDLFAMVCDDAVVRGAEPIAVTTILDVRTLDDNERSRTAISQLAQGYVEAAELSDTVIVNGEAAELGDRVGGYRVHDTDLNYNWAASVMWVVHESRVLTGEKIKKGDSLISLNENGFRANGLSLVRDVLSEHLGDNWHDEQIGNGNKTLGKYVQEPSIIYSKFINMLTGGFDLNNPAMAQINGIAHITGGGLPEKLQRMLAPAGVGAIIDTPPFPPQIMHYVQQLGGVADKEAYKTWNMGSGMVIATPEPDKVLRLAEQNDFDAQHIGKIVGSKVLSIKSQGLERPGEWLHYF